MIPSETLRHFSLLADLKPAFLEEMASIGQEKTANQGEWLFREGSNATDLYLIVRGNVELKLKLDEKRNIHPTLTVLHAGDALGWSAIVEPYVYTLGAVASDNAQLVKFDSQALRALLEKYPDQGYILMRGIAQEMGSRVNVLSDRVPTQPWRFVLSMIFSAVGIGTGALIVLFGISAILGLIVGSSGAGQAIPVALVCLIFPAVLLLLARMIYMGESRSAFGK